MVASATVREEQARDQCCCHQIVCSYYGASQDTLTRELYEVQGITCTRTPRALSRGETNEASSWSGFAQLPI